MLYTNTASWVLPVLRAPPVPKGCVVQPDEWAYKARSWPVLPVLTVLPAPRG